MVEVIRILCWISRVQNLMFLFWSVQLQHNHCHLQVVTDAPRAGEQVPGCCQPHPQFQQYHLHPPMSIPQTHHWDWSPLYKHPHLLWTTKTNTRDIPTQWPHLCQQQHLLGMMDLVQISFHHDTYHRSTILLQSCKQKSNNISIDMCSAYSGLLLRSFKIPGPFHFWAAASSSAVTPTTYLPQKWSYSLACCKDITLS